MKVISCNRWLLTCVFLGLMAAGAIAEVTFFVHPDGGLDGADASRDQAFQAALTRPMTEFDFATFGHGYIAESTELKAGVVRVRPNLLDVAGNNAADPEINGGLLIETYPLVPTVAGIIEGGGAALLNRTFAGDGADVVGAAIEFTFSEPVEGFGAWILDDILEPSGFTLKITEVGGATVTSSLMDSGNGITLAVEGFIGAVSTVGIVKAVIEQQTIAGAPSDADFFYVDHVQVGGRFPPEICDNGVDDNADGKADCEDSECTGDPACPEVCADGVDNNGDGLVDCDDPQCRDNPAHPECGETLCSDGQDNDGDGQGDCADPDCFGKTGCTAESLCADGEDNDGDGLSDCSDPDCADDAACPEICDDGVDNDADGKVDCQDFDCTDFETCTEICDDGIDNDGDMRIDCVDPECAGSPDCDDGPQFFIEPDGRLADADPDRDLAFRAAVGGPVDEFDFAEFVHEYIMEPSPLFADGVNIRPNLLDVNGNPAADLSINGNRLIETFVLVPDVPGIVEGDPGGGAALLNRTFAGNAADVVGAAIEFTFSEPVGGFGAWILDDFVEPSQFVLKVTLADGATHTSPPMDGGNGSDGPVVDGFIGAVSKVGITRVVIEQQTLGGVPSNADFFYLDHLQIGSLFPACSDPFADLDGDGDVDQSDFGLFQACFTGPEATAPRACKCADSNKDARVDSHDLQVFEGCASGPSVPASLTCDDR